jgi:hypothetical protein
MLRSPALAMVPSVGAATRSPASTALADAGAAGLWRGGPAATGTVPGSASRPVLGAAALAGGGCCCWPLPADATCAAVARGVFREVASVLALPDELKSDGLLMTSELAANTLHAHANIEFDGAGGWPIAGAPELWIYLRRAVGRWELAVKVFDSLSGWKDDLAPEPGAAGADAVSGRGLGVVAGLSAGRWGQHLTRSRFGGWKVPGKAVWFARPVPAGIVPEPLRRTRLAPGRAARALEEMLAERGLGGGLLRAQEPSAGMSVLSVRYGLTVWCRDSAIWWRSPDGRQAEQVPTDLVEVAEQIVCACAEMDAGIEPWHRGQGRLC